MNVAQKLEPSVSDLGIHVDVFSTDDVGAGAVAWIAVTPRARGVVGHDAQALQIEETGSVPVLRVFHQGDIPVLLPADLVLSGGLQTRVIDRTVVIAPRSVADIPVRCVEAGRWSHRSGEKRRSFTTTEAVSVPMRRNLSRSKGETLTRTGVYGVDQGTVWQYVERELTTSGVRSETSSYDSYLSEVKTRQREAVRAAKIRPAPGANGAVVMAASGAWLEAFPTEDALAASADGLLADLFASTERRLTSVPSRIASRLVPLLLRMGTHRIPSVPGTLGEAYAIQGFSTCGSCVLMAGAVVHLAIGFGR
jgi:hypothetical protein